MAVSTPGGHLSRPFFLNGSGHGNHEVELRISENEVKLGIADPVVPAIVQRLHRGAEDPGLSLRGDPGTLLVEPLSGRGLLNKDFHKSLPVYGPVLPVRANLRLARTKSPTTHILASVSMRRCSCLRD